MCLLIRNVLKYTPVLINFKKVVSKFMYLGLKYVNTNITKIIITSDKKMSYLQLHTEYLTIIGRIFNKKSVNVTYCKNYI